MKHSIFTLTIILTMLTTVAGQWDILNESGYFEGIDFINDEVGWIKSQDRFLKTEDGGETWESIILNNNLKFSLFDFINDSIGWAVGSEGIFKTQDGGYSWKSQYEFYEEIEIESIFIVNDSVLYAAGNEVERRPDPLGDRGIGIILKSKDGGFSWIKKVLKRTETSFYSLWFFNSDTGLVIGRDGEPSQGILYRTTNGGNTWAEYKFPALGSMTDLVFVNNSIGYFLASEEGSWGWRSNNYIYKTTNGGKNWALKYTSDKDIIYYFPLANQTIFAAFLDGSTYNLKKSLDGGETWNEVSNLSTDRIEIYFVNENLLFALGTGFSRSVDSGENWITQNSFDFPFKDVYFLDRYKGFACGGKSGGGEMGSAWGGMFASYDGGQSWIKSNSPGAKVHKVDFVDTLIGFSLSTHGGGWWYETHIYKTIDGGNSWDGKQECSFAKDLVFRDSQQGWIVGRNGYNDTTFIIQTTDGGDTWESIWEKTNYGSLYSIFDIEGTLWAVGDSGLILTSVGSYSFKIISGVTSVGLNNIFFSDAQHGWIAGEDSLFFKTIDGGQSWNELPIFGYHINDMFFKDSLHGWAVGHDTCVIGSSGRGRGGRVYRGVILETEDGGSHWNIVVKDLPGQLTSLHFKDGHGWAVGKNGLVLRSDGATWVDQNAGKIYPTKFTLRQNYPNPFNPKTTISYQLAVISEVELSIYNILGQKVATLVSEKQPAETYKVEWDASGFASGIYFYRVETGKGFVQSRKLILLK